MRKLEEGQYDALVLAYAGVHRMGYDGLIRHVLPTHQFVPPVGQGSIAVESSRFLDSTLKERIVHALDHADTHRCLLAERAFLRTMEGGCSIPSFALATLTESGDIQLHGGLVSLSGEEYIEFTQTAPVAQAEGLGMAVAERVLAHGGTAILASIREQRGEL